MKETKVYVDELPDICDECPFQDKETYKCILLPKYAITPFLQSCPLKSLHEYKKELVGKMLNRVRKELDGDYNQYRINYIIDQIQKEFEK